MNNIQLNVFCNAATQTHILPDIKDGRYVIELFSMATKLKDDFEIPIICEDGLWKINNGHGVFFKVGNYAYEEKLLKIGDVIDVCTYDGKYSAVIIVDMVNPGSMIFDKYWVDGYSPITIGSSPTNTITYAHPYMLSNHAKISADSDGSITATDLGDRSMLYVNNRLAKTQQLHYGDIVQLLGMRIVFLGSVVAISRIDPGIRINLKRYTKSDVTLTGSLTQAQTQWLKNRKKSVLFQRSPRIEFNLDKEPVEIQEPPVQQIQDKPPFILVVGPSLTMSIAMLATLGITLSSSASGQSNTASLMAGLVMCLSMLIAAVLWPVLLKKHQEKTEKEREDFREQQYMAYIFEKRSELADKLQSNNKVLLDISPPPALLITRAMDHNRRIWERIPTDEDFLDIRIGTGNKPFDVPIVVPKQTFSLVRDPLRSQPELLKKEYEFSKDMPINLKLDKTQTIGVIGKRRRILSVVMNSVICLASLNCYTDVKLVFIYNKSEEPYFSFARNLPHAWNLNRDMRFTASNKEDAHIVMSHLYDVIKSRSEKQSNVAIQHLPFYVVFIADDSLIEEHPIMAYLTNSNHNLGFSTFFLYDRLGNLPSDCKAIIHYDDKVFGLHRRTGTRIENISLNYDQVDKGQMGMFARQLMRLKVREMTTTSSIPEKISFLQMFNCGRIEHLNIPGRWEQSMPQKSLAAPIGVKSGGSLFSLDLNENYHGPHGLVAGTVGSGKSETLQTFILSLAVNFHPDDVGFILIDYKGGGMANSFVGLPHLLGTITNLSGNQIRRSLVSIQSELKRRQALFTQSGVNHIDKYQKLYKDRKVEQPLPHLIIASDEFAELKAQQSEFMQELVSAARIGRSLGVHLILATQKPAGVVDDQIWSNSRFKLCCKVLDRADSNEMLKRPEAAAITQPGRFYIQVGNNEIFELVQSAYSGAPYIPSDQIESDDNKRVVMLDNIGQYARVVKDEAPTSKDANSQLSEIVNFISEYAKSRNIIPRKLWIDPLPNLLFFNMLSHKFSYDGKKWHKNQRNFEIALCKVDDPAQQDQFEYMLPMGQMGHVAIYGGPGMGKTTLLQSLIYSMVMDYSPDDVSIYILDFGGRSTGYFEILPHVGGVVFPDDEGGLIKCLKLFEKELEIRKMAFAEYGAASPDTYRKASGKRMPAMVLVLDNFSAFYELFVDYEDYLNVFAREGINYGIYLVITGQNSNAIRMKITQNISLSLALTLTDKFDYMNILGRTDKLEPDAVRGRGLLKIDKRVLEFQTALSAQSENEVERIVMLKEIFSQMRDNWKGLTAKPIPRLPEQLTLEFMMSDQDVEQALSVGQIPIGYDVNDVELLTVGFDAHCFASLGHMQSGKTNLNKMLIRLLSGRSDYNICVVDDQNQSLGQTALDCNVNMYYSTEDEIDAFSEQLAQMGEPNIPLVVIIENYEYFYQTISEQALQILFDAAKQALEYKILFIIAGEPGSISSYSAEPISKLIVSSKNGLLLGGKADEQSLLDFKGLSYTDSSAWLDPGLGYWLDRKRTRLIKIPLVR